MDAQAVHQSDKHSIAGMTFPVLLVMSSPLEWIWVGLAVFYLL